MAEDMRGYGMGVYTNSIKNKRVRCNKWMLHLLYRMIMLQPMKRDFFQKTMKANGWNYTFIGEGDSWKGFETRIEGYYNYLSALPNEQLVVLSDARDVVCLRSPKAFIEGFSSFGKNMVVSMDVFCDGHTNVASDYIGGQCVALTNYWAYHSVTVLPFRKFVNAGLIAGRAFDVRQFLKWTMDKHYVDDQFALGMYMNTFPERIAVDTNASLLHTSTFGVNAGIQDIHSHKNDSPTLAELFGRGAFFLHIPGCKFKGQKCIYTTVCNLLDSGVCAKMIHEGYSFKEPSWNGFDGYEEV